MHSLKRKMFLIYKKWRNENIYCPAFEEKVRFSLKGWRHITGATGSKKRVKKDVYRRLRLLPYVKEVTQKSTTIQNIVKKNGRTFYVLEAMMQIQEKGRKEWRKIRVVFEEDKKGVKVFLSVMDKKNKNKV